MSDARTSRRTALRGALAAGVGLAAATSVTACAGADGPDPREVVTRAFDRATREGILSSTGDFYDILTDDVSWTVGSWPERTYTSRADFLARGSSPVLDRLSGPIVPRVREMHVDGAVVTTVWEGLATARDGQPYNNLYSWSFTVAGERVSRALAFLDLRAVDDLVRRIPLPTR